MDFTGLLGLRFGGFLFALTLGLGCFDLFFRNFFHFGIDRLQFKASLERGFQLVFIVDDLVSVVRVLPVLRFLVDQLWKFLMNL
jgi:hypothetical protein